MTDEISQTETVEVTRTVEVTETVVGDAPAIDEATASVHEEVVAETTTVTVNTAPETDGVTTYAPRGAWDFTDGQRIVIGVLLWLNIIVLTVIYLALTDQLVI
jgi:hypothetical protein